jgi:integrase
MGSIYERKDSPNLWWSYTGPAGQRVSRRSPYKPGQERVARRALQKIEAAIGSAKVEPDGSDIPTLTEYAERWIAGRKSHGIRNHAEEARHLRLHVLPRLGELPVTGVTRAHVKDLLALWRKADKAPRTIRNFLSTLRSLFNDLIDDEIVDANPCDVHRKHLGRAGDKDPEWRATALYQRDELVQLISDPRLPTDRRVLYAIAFLTGSRLGEVAGLCWRHLLTDEPLNKLLIAHSYDHGTKNETPREVPVHPLLALVLEHWRREGYEREIGWSPQPNDMIVPSPRSRGGNGAHKHRAAGTMRTKNQVGKRFTRDLEILDIPHRRFHDSRRTFISLAQADGAQREHLLPVTHTSTRDRAAFDLYTSIPWSTRCAAVAIFRPVPPDNYSELARRIVAEEGCYAGCYVASQAPEITGEKCMEAPGVEPYTTETLTPRHRTSFPSKGSGSLGVLETERVLGSRARLGRPPGSWRRFGDGGPSGTGSTQPGSRSISEREASRGRRSSGRASRPIRP